MPQEDVKQAPPAKVPAGQQPDAKSDPQEDAKPDPQEDAKPDPQED